MQNEADFLKQLFKNFPGVLNFDDLVLPDFFIEWALEQKEKNIRADVARSHKIPPRYLNKLINDDDCTMFAHLICRIRIPFADEFPGNYYIPYNIDQQIENRYSQFTQTCKQRKKDGYCDCMEIVANM